MFRGRPFFGGPVGEGERSPEHSEAALPSPAQPRPLPPPPELPVNVEPRIPEESRFQELRFGDPEHHVIMAAAL